MTDAGALSRSTDEDVTPQPVAVTSSGGAFATSAAVLAAAYILAPTVLILGMIGTAQVRALAGSATMRALSGAATVRPRAGTAEVAPLSGTAATANDLSGSARIT